MSDYQVALNRVSSSNNKSLNIPKSILNYFYYFNDLSNECNQQMRMKSSKKALILLGKYKIEKIELNKNNTFKHIVFKNDKNIITIFGSFILMNGSDICYYNNYKVKVSKTDIL